MEVFNQITDDILLSILGSISKEFCKQFMSSSEGDVILASNDFLVIEFKQELSTPSDDREDTIRWREGYYLWPFLR